MNSDDRWCSTSERGSYVASAASAIHMSWPMSIAARVRNLRPVGMSALCVLAIAVLGCSEPAEEIVPSTQASLTQESPAQDAKALLTPEAAITVGQSDAAHLTQDRPIDASSAELRTYAGVSGIIPVSDPNPRPADARIWLVTLKGRFYEPSGPPIADATPSIREPICSVITVLVDDAARSGIGLTFEPSTGC
jgi:hypothetical protein